jgi:glycosyltransferase involved in cell wall biosynthesis
MNINLMAPYNDLGYGNASKNILKSLVSQGHHVAYFPIGNISGVQSEDLNILKDSLSNQKVFDYKAPSIRIWHQNALAESVGRGKRLGWPFFELDKFSKEEIHHLQSCDALFVSSAWAKSVVQAHVKTPTFIVPLGVDTKIFNPSIVKAKGVGSPTIFFNCGKWEIRKGHDILVTAFNLAFKPEDNVELRMMNHNPFLTQAQTERWHDIYLGSPLGEAGKIKILGRVDKHEEVAILMSETDCGVFPYRAEGWNLELLEMMALGKQVIATNYSAPTEFCTSTNSLLIEPEGLEDAYDGIWFHGQGKWASLGDDAINQIARYMQLVHKNKDLRNNKRGVETAKQFTWLNTANLITQHIRGL